MADSVLTSVDVLPHPTPVFDALWKKIYKTGRHADLPPDVIPIRRQ